MQQPSVPLVDVTADFREHGSLISSAIDHVIQSGRFILGPEVSQLESQLAQFVQQTNNTEVHDSSRSPVHCIGVSDGTAALQLCLMALGIGNGDEVITVPFTWVSTAEVIPLVGATPVFADVHPRTFLIDPDLLASRVTENTKAVIAVSLFGIIPDFNSIRAVLDEAERRHNNTIHIIEDGAQSFGAERQGFKSCGNPKVTLSTTSFFPTKPLACYGDGGAVFTRVKHLADVVKSLRVHGKENSRHTRIGLNSRLDTIQAAILLARFSYFDASIAARRKAAERYSTLLSQDTRIVLPTYDDVVREDGIVCVYGVYTILVLERDEVAKILKSAGVSCALYYAVGCHQQPAFLAFDPPVLPVTERLSEIALSLPMHAYLTESVQMRVVQALRNALDKLGVTDKPHY